MYCSIDWLNSELEKIPDKTGRRQLILEFLTTAADFLVTESIGLLESLRKEAEAENDHELLTYVKLYVAFAHRSHGESKEAERVFLEVLDAFPEVKPGFNAMIIAQMIAFEYWANGKRDLAFEYAYKSLRLGENSTSGEGMGWAYFQFGVFYFDMKDFDSSLSYFRKALDESRVRQMPYQTARIHSGIGSIHIARNEMEEALKENRLALEGYRQVGHETAVSRALNDLGVISMRRNQNEDAENYLREALDIRERLRYAPGAITTRMELARLMKQTGRTEEESDYLHAALEMSEKTNSKQKAIACHLMLSELYKKKNDPWKALEHVEKYNTVKAELAGEETSNRIQHLQQKFATEKSEQEAEIHRLKNVELKQLNDEIAEKNKSILDSIHYAKRIQDSLLPNEKYIERILRELNG